jgi:DNA-binding SARP family transcriptional activator
MSPYLASTLPAGTRLGEPGVLLRALGPVAVTDGERRFPLPRGRASSLLAWMLAHRATGVSVEASLIALWPYLDRTAASRELRRNLAVLRRRLAPVGATVVRRDRQLALTLPTQAAVDVDLFEGWLAAAEDATAYGAGHHALGLVRQALALWRRDEPFVEIRDTPAGAREAVRLDDRRIYALDLRDGLRLQLDHDSRLLADLEVKVTAHPAHELGWRQLMVCLNDAGHGAGALRTFQACHRSLGELGLAPSDETRRVEAALLAGRAPDADLYMPRVRVRDRHVPEGSPPAGSTIETLLDDAWADPSRAYLAVLVGGRGAAAEVAASARRRGAETVVVAAESHCRLEGVGPIEEVEDPVDLITSVSARRLRAHVGPVIDRVPLVLIVECAEEAPPRLLRAVGSLWRGPGPILITLTATAERLGPLSDLVLHADRVLEHPPAL